MNKQIFYLNRDIYFFNLNDITSFCTPGGADAAIPEQNHLI